jgi:hypothetical protein
MQVEFDPEKAATNLKKHGVSLEEAVSCLLDPMALVREDENARGEMRFVLVGLSREAQLLTVCYTLREEETIRLISARRVTGKEEGSMRKEYDFSGAKRAKDVPHLAKLQAEVTGGKTRITILIDDDLLVAFRARAEREGKGYQTLINATLRAAIAPEKAPVTVESLRQILREELQDR